VTTTVNHSFTIFQDTLEERHRVFTNRLAQLTLCARLPDRGGYDRDTLDALLRWARDGVADAALALQRMSEGTYGVCALCRHDIPVGRLRARPDARFCVPCQGRAAAGSG
jgi:DnaK suppressor protein